MLLPIQQKARVGKLYSVVQIQCATKFYKESVIGIEPGSFVYLVFDCFNSTDYFSPAVKMQQRLYDPQSLKYFLSGPSQKESANLDLRFLFSIINGWVSLVSHLVFLGF